MQRRLVIRGKKLDLGKHGLFIASLVLFVTASGFAQTNVSAGNVSGTWRLAYSPYQVNGEIAIPNDSTLTIEPGVEVVFMGHYKFNVQGRLLAVGTQKDTIRFTADDTQTGWHGIRFLSTPNTNDTSKFIYCSLKNGKANIGSGLDRCGGAIMIDGFDKVLVSHCLFDSNVQSGDEWAPVQAGPAIYVTYASPKITNSTFSNNVGSKGSAISCITSPQAIVSNNVLFSNGGRYGAIASCFNSSTIISGNIIFNNVASEAAGGILVDNNSTPMITNNVIVHNQGLCGGVCCYKGGNPVLISNTIAYNSASIEGGGIYCWDNSSPIFTNNIIYGNSAPNGSQVYINDASSDPVFQYCDIQGGRDGFGGAGAGVNYTGLYEHNIDSAPLFMFATSDDYRLSDSSRCIGAGIDSTQIAGMWYRVPPSCIGGYPRPSPAGSMPDIGACENLLGFPLVGVGQELSHPLEFLLCQNFPNPFNPSTTIKYELPRTSQVTLSVYDILGGQVSVLVNERREAGVHEVKFEASGLSSGVYFYRLHAGDFVATKRLLLLK